MCLKECNEIVEAHRLWETLGIDGVGFQRGLELGWVLWQGFGATNPFVLFVYFEQIVGGFLEGGGNYAVVCRELFETTEFCESFKTDPF